MPNRRSKQFAFLGITLFLVVLALEGLLFVSRSVSPAVETLLASPWSNGTLPWVEDRKLEKRPNPRFPEHDARGFRNPQALSRSDVVVLGDSQTYGTGVESDSAWPQVLRRQTGKQVYSMAFPGYGPVHSLILLEEAQSLKPKTLVEAFYAGNDLYDAFNLVYARGQHGELKSSDPEILNKVAEAERVEALSSRIDGMARLRGISSGDSQPQISSQPAESLLTRYSGLYGILRRTRFELQNAMEALRFDSEKAWQGELDFAGTHPECCQIFSEKPYRTVFLSDYRLLALDQTDVRIEQGLQVSLKAIKAMHASSEANGNRFVVLLIPTKEFVFAERWTKPSPLFVSLIETETKMRTQAFDFFKANQIDYIDALPALRAELEKGVQPYPESRDGHPNAAGHRAIAATVAAYVSRSPQ